MWPWNNKNEDEPIVVDKITDASDKIIIAANVAWSYYGKVFFTNIKLQCTADLDDAARMNLVLSHYKKNFKRLYTESSGLHILNFNVKGVQWLAVESLFQDTIA